MSWLNLKASEAISLVAIIATFVISALNYRLTRRQFRASYYASVQADLFSEHSSLEAIDELSYEIQNLSDKYSVSDVRVSISVSEQFWLKLIPSKWKKLHSRVILVIKPGEIKNGWVKNFSEFIGENFPSVLKRGEPKKDGTSEWQILKNRPLSVRFLVSYRPGIEGAKISRITKSYKVEPANESHGEKKSYLIGWYLTDSSDERR
jgi:hypothetical protein